MADENSPTFEPAPASQSTPPADTGAEQSGPTMGLLTPVFMVWPGKRDGGSWTLLWFGVAFVVAGLLPWGGRNDRVVVTTDGQVMSSGDLAYKKAQHDAKVKVGHTDVAPVPQIASIGKPAETSLGKVLVLLCGLAMFGAGLVNAFHQRLLVFTPVLMASVMVGLALWFTFTTDPGVFETDGGGVAASANPVRSYAQLIPVVTSLGGLFGSPGSANYEEMVSATTLFGPGVYVALLADIFLFLFLALTIVSAVVGSKGKDDPKAKGGGGGGARKRPGGKR